MITLTEEQKEIVKALGEVNTLLINAFAGTGKTTTLKELTERYPNYRFLYLAFNRSIAQEARRKFPKNTEVYTTHGFAFKYVKYALDMKKLRSSEYRAREIMDILTMPDWDMANLVLSLFNAFCFSGYTELNEHFAKSVIAKDAFLLFSYRQLSRELGGLEVSFVVKKVKDLWDMMERQEILMTHNFYLKYFHINMEKFAPYFKNKYDVVLLDEAQDTNEVTLEIVRSFPCKKVIVGDRHQQIYGFRKSLNAMEKFEADKTLYLSISFRITNNVASNATNILRILKGETKEIKATKESTQNASGSLAVITRTNASLIRELHTYYIQGDIEKCTTVRSPEDIFRLPLSVYYFNIYTTTKSQDIKQLIKEKWILQFESMEELEEYANSIADVELTSAIKLTKENFPLPILYEEAVKIYQNPKAEVFLTTAHTSKGLEWDRVRLTSDFPDLIDLIAGEYPNLNEFRYRLKTGDERAVSIGEEINLYYVAMTRAKNILTDYTPNEWLCYAPENEVDIAIQRRHREKQEEGRTGRFKEI